MKNSTMIFIEDEIKRLEKSIPILVKDILLKGSNKDLTREYASNTGKLEILSKILELELSK